jgi:hypothetical protein
VQGIWAAHRTRNQVCKPTALFQKRQRRGLSRAAGKVSKPNTWARRAAPAKKFAAYRELATLIVPDGQANKKLTSQSALAPIGLSRCGHFSFPLRTGCSCASQSVELRNVGDVLVSVGLAVRLRFAKLALHLMRIAPTKNSAAGYPASFAPTKKFVDAS